MICLERSNIFGSTNPNVAKGYSGTEGEVVPFEVDATEVIEFPVGRMFDKIEFDRRAKRLKKGQVLVARNVADTGPLAEDATATARSDIYAVGRGTPMKQVKAESDTLTDEQKKVATILRKARERELAGKQQLITQKNAKILAEVGLIASEDTLTPMFTSAKVRELLAEGPEVLSRVKPKKELTLKDLSLSLIHI